MEERFDKLERMLKEMYRVNRENHEYLRKIDQRQRYGVYWKFFWFAIVLGSALGIYYFVQPYVDQAVNFYDQFETSLVQLNTIPEQVKGIFK